MSYKIFWNLVGSVRRHDCIISIKSETNLELYIRWNLRNIGCKHTVRRDYQSICNYLLHQETAIFSKTTFLAPIVRSRLPVVLYIVYRIPKFLHIFVVYSSKRTFTINVSQFFYIFSDWFRIIYAATMTIVVSRCNAKEISNSFVQCT